MVTTATGLNVPAGTDPFDPVADLGDLATSLEGRIIVPVANVAARTALVAAVTPSVSEPLYVNRADAGAGAELEVTTDGTTWRTLAALTDPPYLQATDTGGVQGIAGNPVKSTAAHVVLTPGLWLVLAGAAVAVDGTKDAYVVSVFIVGTNTELTPALRSPANNNAAVGELSNVATRAAVVTVSAVTDVQVIAAPANANSVLRFTSGGGGPSAWITALRVRG